MREVFPIQAGKCSDVGDPGYKCVGTGQVAVLLGGQWASLKM